VYRPQTSWVLFGATTTANVVRELEVVDLDGPGPLPVQLVAGGSFLIFGSTPSPNSCGEVLSPPATLAVGPCCDSIDFNRDGVFPDLADIADFLFVYGGGLCPIDPPVGQGCNDAYFNNDGVFPDTQGVAKFIEVFGGGSC
jgi:hypothetical protein